MGIQLYECVQLEWFADHFVYLPNLAFIINQIQL